MYQVRAEPGDLRLKRHAGTRRSCELDRGSVEPEPERELTLRDGMNRDPKPARRSGKGAYGASQKDVVLAYQDSQELQQRTLRTADQAPVLHEKNAQAFGLSGKVWSWPTSPPAHG